MLDQLVQRHVQKHGELQDSAALLRASDDFCNCAKCRGLHTFWSAHQDEILKGLKERWTGFEPEFYATKDTFTEDALRCYDLHRRPKGTDCIDWQSDRKRLTPENRPKHVYLCDFCPVASTVATAMRHVRGMYRKEPGEID